MDDIKIWDDVAENYEETLITEKTIIILQINIEQRLF